MESIIPESLRKNYASSAFASPSSGRAYPFGPRPALIVVDVCAAYLTPGCSLYTADRFAAALVKTEELITLFRQYDLPIIFTKVEFQSPAESGAWHQKAHGALDNFLPNNPMGDFPPESSICRPTLTRGSELVLPKHYASSFFGTSLASTLNGMRIETVVVCGFSTSGCVRATALDAIQHGFCPFVVGEACGDRHQWVQESNLFDLQAKYAEVVTVAEIGELLQKNKK